MQRYRGKQEAASSICRMVVRLEEGLRKGEQRDQGWKDGQGVDGEWP